MDTCCSAGAPVVSDYAPKGAMESVNGTDVYVTGSGPAGVVAITDIFGLSYPQCKQVADRLAEGAGIAVAVPDVFHGKPWTKDKFPPKPEDNLIGWIQSDCSYDKVSKDVANAAQLLRARGASKLGLAGFCFGAVIAFEAGAGKTPGLEGIAAVGGVHPSLFGRDAELAAGVACPVALLSAQGDPLESVQQVIEGRPELAPKSVFKRFGDMTHGWCAARGDWKDPHVAARATEAIGILVDFFKANLL